MILKYHNKEITLKNCTSFYSRLRGFMGYKNINKALLFEKCNSIHTFFMKQNIDVILCNKENKILYYYKNIKKNKIILPKKNVYKVFETPANYFDIESGKYMEVIK